MKSDRYQHQLNAWQASAAKHQTRPALLAWQAQCANEIEADIRYHEAGAAEARENLIALDNAVIERKKALRENNQ